MATPAARMPILLLVCWATAGLARAQEAPPVPAKRSLADGLVRQLVEVEKLQPPRSESGLEMAAGDGPLVLMVRGKDGRLQLQAIERGLGEHGEAPAKKLVDAPEEVEEGAADAPARAAKLAKVTIVRRGDTVTLGTDDLPDRLRGPALDRAALRPVLQERFAAAKGTKVAGQLLVDANADALLQDVLTTVEAARSVGFTTVMFDGVTAGKQKLPAELQQQVLDLPRRFEWHVERIGPAKQQPVCDGELLLLVDGPATWGEISPLYAQFARAGIWRISFVCQADGKTRWKVPANLPFDRGL